MNNILGVFIGPVHSCLITGVVQSELRDQISDGGLNLQLVHQARSYNWSALDWS